MQRLRKAGDELQYRDRGVRRANHPRVLVGGIESTFIGVFPSLAEAKEALRGLGYLDEDDFRRRLPE